MAGLGVVRCATAGSVDDGKSTLIGRLLLDCQALTRDQLEQVSEASRRRGFARTELALLTDGLRAEREQGITIDVAWRYFSTPRRRFVLADTPGHAQYTRNMVSGASQADLAIVLTDAVRGITEQTRRHLSLAALLRVPSIVVAVNKMDRVDWNESRFVALRSELAAFAAQLPWPASLRFLPVSALHGDNVAVRVSGLSYYQGPSLLELMEAVEDPAPSAVGAVFATQWVIRPQSEASPDYRGLGGYVASGELRVGDVVTVFPSGAQAHVAHLATPRGPTMVARHGEAVTVQLQEDVDVARGDLLATRALRESQRFAVELAVVGTRPLKAGGRLVVKQLSRRVRAVVEEVAARLDLLTGQQNPATTLVQNEIGRMTLRTAEPLALWPYAEDRTLGSLLLLDETTGETLAAAMVSDDYGRSA